MVASSVLVEHAIVTIATDAVAAVVLRAARPAAVRAAPGAVDHADADVDRVTIARLAAVRAVAGLARDLGRCHGFLARRFGGAIRAMM